MTTKTEPKTAFVLIEEKLRNRIISGDLPGGTRLQGDALRREFDVSTSTVREALSRLLACSLVVSQPNIGFRVAPLSRSDFISVARVRKLLEIEALSESLENRNDEWEATLAGAYHLLERADRAFVLEGNLDQEHEWRQRNQAFHEAMVAACKNRYLLDFRRSINYNAERYRALIPDISRNALHVPDQHRALFESAVSGRREDCISLMCDHISTTVDLLIDHLPQS